MIAINLTMLQDRFDLVGKANETLQNYTMATNPPKGDGHRDGAVRDRSQVLNTHNDRYTKRDTGTGRFMDQKADGKPFKGVRKEK